MSQENTPKDNVVTIHVTHLKDKTVVDITERHEAPPTPQQLEAVEKIFPKNEDKTE